MASRVNTEVDETVVSDERVKGLRFGEDIRPRVEEFVCEFIIVGVE